MRLSQSLEERRVDLRVPLTGAEVEIYDEQGETIVLLSDSRSVVRLALPSRLSVLALLGSLSEALTGRATQPRLRRLETCIERAGQLQDAGRTDEADALLDEARELLEGVR